MHVLTYIHTYTINKCYNKNFKIHYSYLTTEDNGKDISRTCARQLSEVTFTLGCCAGSWEIQYSRSEANSGNVELSEDWGWAFKCALYSASFVIAAADRGGWEDTAGPDRGG